MAIRVVLLAVQMLFASFASAGADEPGADELYRPFAELLGDFAAEYDLDRNGLVSSFDYLGAIDDERTAGRLARQRRQLAEFDPAVLVEREQALAFWLNAYNFFMIAHILENPRRGQLISSVRDYGNLFNPYRVFRRDLFAVGERNYSLSEIENDILLGRDFRDRGWKDARVHFAVNCASVGCPALRVEIFTPDNVNSLLEENTRRALNTPLHLRIDGDILYLTSLFDWYEGHFANQSGSVRQFLVDHAEEETAAAIAATRSIRYIDYDWSLNSPHNMQPWRE